LEIDCKSEECKIFIDIYISAIKQRYGEEIEKYYQAKTDAWKEERKEKRTCQIQWREKSSNYC
jgi:hypothetical protein